MRFPSLPVRPFQISAMAARLGSFLLLAALGLAALPILGQSPTINKFSNLNAGAIVPGASAGTVILNSPSGTRTATGGTQLGSSTGTLLGSLTLSGAPGHTWTVDAVGPFTLTRAGGGSLRATAVDFQPSPARTGIFPPSGTTPLFYLGVSLTVGTSAAVPQGSYTGSFNLRVRDKGKSSTMAFTVAVRVDPVITLALLAPLRFGDVFVSSVSGTVVLSPAGSRTTTGGATLGNLSTPGAATLTVTGARNTIYAITLPTSSSLTGPGGTMTIASFLSSPSATGLLSGVGSQTLSIGATLSVPANQADGDYAGTFPVTVAYN